MNALIGFFLASGVIALALAVGWGMGLGVFWWWERR